MHLHQVVAKGDITALNAALAAGQSSQVRDEHGKTLLMTAAESPHASVEVMRVLIEHGADVNALTTPQPFYEVDNETRSLFAELGFDASLFDQANESPSVDSVLSVAMKKGTREKIQLLLTEGANPAYVDPNGYGIVLCAMYRPDGDSPEDVIAILDMLIDAGAPLDVASKYGETAVRVASHRGWFTVVTHLVARGADPKPLGWTPLFHKIAAGDLAAVAQMLDDGASLDQRDDWQRTPFLFAVHAGHRSVAELLWKRGGDHLAVGHCGQTALMYAISRDDADMLNWLITIGCDFEATDEFGDFPLLCAAEQAAVDCVGVLLAAGASVDRRSEHDRGAIHEAATPEIVRLLVAAGACLSDVDVEMRMQLTGTRCDDAWELKSAEFARYRSRTFGKRNPEKMNNPFWDQMVRTRVPAYQAAAQFGAVDYDREPVWCFRRFGQSMTQLDDGRYVEIGGEHEDHYDPDFCIYNDVIVHNGDGTFDLYGYPPDVFPPTDFHTATLVGDYIYILGNLGYPEQRRPQETPVYRLNCRTWAIERVPCEGDPPGWISRHCTRLVGNRQLVLQGGHVVDETDYTENESEYCLDINTFRWTRWGRSLP